MTLIAGALNAEIIERAGGVNVADPQDARVRRGIASVSIEQVIVADPDTFVTWDPRFYAGVWDDRLWAGVDAVRNQRVYLSPTTRLMLHWIGVSAAPAGGSSEEGWAALARLQVQI